MTRIVLHIDRLVLRGIDPADAAAVSDGLRAELQNRLENPEARAALFASGGRYRLNAGSVRIPHGQAAAATGQALAGRIVPRTAP